MQIIFILFGSLVGVFLINALIALPVAALLYYALGALGHPAPFVALWALLIVVLFIFGGRRAN